MAQSAAWKLEGQARQVAIEQVQFLAGIPVLVCIVAATLTMWLVGRMRRQQIQFTRDLAVAAAAAQGATDVVALIHAQTPGRSRLGWLLAMVGSLFTLLGAFLSFGVVLVMRSEWTHLSRTDILTGSSIGAIPLLIGMVVFVVGVKKIHAARHIVPRPIAAAAGA